jgi:CDP-paratose synthetase
MKILVSGGTGFLGSKIVHNLHKIGHQITILVRKSSETIDIINKDISFVYYTDLNIEISKNNYEAIFFCATKYSYDKDKVIELLDANLILPLNLLKAAVNNKVKYFINIDTLVDDNINDYSMSKSNLRYWLKKFDNSINIVNIRIDHFFGPGDKSFKFINSMIESLLSNEKHIDLTKGDQKRAFIYVDDVVSAICLIIKNLHSVNCYQEYNIAGSKSYSIKYIVEKIKLLTNNQKTELLWGKLPHRKNEIFDTSCNLDLIKSLGWKQNTDLSSGLLNTINFYKK